MKQMPQRTCVGCMQKKDKKDLIRIVKNKQNEISVDKTGKKEGRGIYICDNQKCLEKAIKSKRIEKSFETAISEEIYNDLRGVILGK
ncbi:MAG: YlxR family protein [Clostridia bacterium]|nr:YlxR family protein [Clostridia bacterium]